MYNKWNPFDRPQPTVDCLMHEAILVQAWKKAHNYIRIHNWYADILELDLSAANLQSNIEKWRIPYIQEDYEKLQPLPLKLVPAPKAGEWEFASISDSDYRWQAKEKNRKTSELRPLAHISIRDQTYATAAMICLADIIETAQGNCSLSSNEAIAQNVSSYGNRLFCEWTPDFPENTQKEASFGWGNNITYRKYSKDYCAFLLRPKDICHQYEQSLNKDKEIGVVSLDIKKFYDNIQPTAVIEKIQNLYNNRPIHTDDQFWNCLKLIMCWRWEKDPLPTPILFNESELPSGLPQGLVASGFFSNAYMLDFDQAMRKWITKDSSKSSTSIMDYCRYVDDIRLVVRWNTKLTDIEQVKRYCESTINKLLHKHSSGLKCNTDKTKYSAYKNLKAIDGRTAIMDFVQHKFSGPIDIEGIAEATAALDGLMSSFEATEPQQPVSPGAPALANILSQSTEVKDDTVQRFAAYRQFKLLQEYRAFIAEETTETSAIELHRVDAEIETAARRMIKLWSQDPSLGVLLRYALNLLPTPELLLPVLDVLQKWIESPNASRIEYWVCLYTVADLFKAGVVETGRNTPSECLAAQSDLEGYRQCLADFAYELLKKDSLTKDLTLPWYVLQQAILFLYSEDQKLLPFIFPTFSPSKSLEHYLNLLVLTEIDNPFIEGPIEKCLPLYIVAYQISKNKKRIIAKLANWIQQTPITLTTLAEIQTLPQNILGELVEHLDKREIQIDGIPFSMQSYPHFSRNKKLTINSYHRNKWLDLIDIITASNNPFLHENAALRLVSELIKKLQQEGEIDPCKITPFTIQVKCNNWTKLSNACLTQKDLNLQLRIEETNFTDTRYAKPGWCEPERIPLMIVGRILRAIIIGNADYTAQPSPFSQSPIEEYHGIRSTWFIRQYGMFHRPDVLAGPQSCFSPWISELIGLLLKWPGCRDMQRYITNGNMINSLETLQKIIQSRIRYQASIYAQSTDIPVYITTCNKIHESMPHLTTVLIQTVRPKREDYCKYGITLDSPSFKPTRRNHLASLLCITEKLLENRKTFSKSAKADLLLFPELSVHEKDLDLIERLIDRTSAIVFCGLVFRNIPGVNGLVNTARWIVPDYKSTGRNLTHVDQGKGNLTDKEKQLNIHPWRPYQTVIEIHDRMNKLTYRLSGSICYDATDLNIASDLKNISDMFIIPANNKDINTFDTMVTALSYHMYQHIALINTGEYGGSSVMAPYKETYERVLVQQHGGEHANISIVDINLSDYQRKPQSHDMKKPPANYKRH